MNPFELANTLQKSSFDLDFYISANPDLRVFNGEIVAISEHLLAYGLSEGRAITCRDIQGFVRILRLISEDGSPSRDLLIRSVLRGWNIWQTPQRAADQDNWPHYSSLADSFRLCGCQVFSIVGDSHSQMFTGRAILDANIACIWALCGGGSARGLRNPNARAGYGNSIKQNLQTGDSLTLFHFGQVDVEFVFYYNAISQGNRRVDLGDLREFISDSCEKYCEFLSSTLNRFRAVSAIFPPCLTDEYIKRGSLNAHIAFVNSEAALAELERGLDGLEFPDLRVRTAMHYLMNSELSRCADKLGVPFLNAWSSTVGPSGLVIDQVNGSGGLDHHLSIDATSERLKPEVLRLLTLRDKS